MKIIMEVQYLTIAQMTTLNKSYLNVYQITQKVFHSTKIPKHVICGAQKHCWHVAYTEITSPHC